MNANGRRILVCCVALGCLFLLVTLQTDTQWPVPITPTTREAVERQPNASTTPEATRTTADPWIVFHEAATNPKPKVSTTPPSDGQTTEAAARRSTYKKRQDMGKCLPAYGKIGVFVAMVASSYETHYRVAQESLKCYLKSTNYTFVLVDLWKDERVNAACKHEQLFFKKHCAASVYLQDFDWMLVLDADTGVVNPNHCIEEWVDDRVDLVFYERFFNWEIASGNYLALQSGVKNTRFARDFLRKWADWEYTQPQNWNGADNGVLQIHILQTVLPDAKAEIKACDKIWRRGKDYDTYMAFVTCCKVFLGAERVFPGKLRILRRAHGFVRDGYLTGDGFSSVDFMLHGWKHNEIGKEGWESPFETMPNVTACTGGWAGWSWRKKKRNSVKEIRAMLAGFEQSTGRAYPLQARVHPYLSEADIGECFPHCDDQT